MSELDATEAELAVLRQAQAEHDCGGDGCPWCRVASATAQVLAEVPA